ncbi:MAG: hypothetical protein PHQ36_13560, partial [Anaerolineales bacterium]|nr:hypothetical protein [Anaerolineales bacterium]
ILFAEEFARLYIESMNGEARQDKMRSQNARYFKASGFVKFAKATGNRFESVKSLLKVPLLTPTYVFKYAYLSAWKQALTKSQKP